MKTKNFKEKISIPDGIELAVNGNVITLKGSKGVVSKTFKMEMFTFDKEGNNLVVGTNKFGVYENEKFRTIKAHIRNMVKGCQEGYEYKLKICSSHFPMNVTVQGNKISVKNLLGEKVPRELQIKEGAKVVVSADVIDVTGPDKDIVSQVAADIEKLTKITKRDRRIFQDGIYITHKDGKQV